MTGYPWSEGDALFASELNAAIANSAAYGPFLPTSGGDVNGTIDASIFQTYTHAGQALGSGGTMQTPLGIYGALSGIKTAGNICFARVNLISDTMAAGGGGLSTLLIDQQSGGTGTTGNRIGLNINFNFAGGPTNKSLGYGEQYGGLWSYATASGSVGGTSGSGNTWGSLWGAISSAHLANGATFWNYCVGHEINMGVSTGASAAYTQGLKIVLGHHNQAATTADYYFGLAKAYLTDTALGNGIVFGSLDGYWPIAATGTLIGTQTSLLPTPPGMSAANGVDFSAVTISGYAFRSPNFSVSGAGHIQTTTGIDLGSVLASGPTDVSKGIDFYTGVYGIGITGGSLNYVLPTGAAHTFIINSVNRFIVTGTGLGFNGTAAVAKPTVTGSKGANAALASLLTALASYGLVTDSST